VHTSNYLTTRAAADILNRSIPTIQQWVERGILKSWKTEGGHRRILHSSVLEVLESQTQDLKPPALPILVVEDDASLIRLYKARFSQWPFEVRIYTAPNGYEGLVLVGEVQPRLLICDLRLPGVNGFNIVRGLCQIERFKELKIVVVSGIPQIEIDANGGLPERVEVMGKPINFARLQEIAQELQSKDISVPTLPEDQG